MNRWIPSFSVHRPVTVVTAFLVIIVVGLITAWRIPVQMMPSGWTPPYLWIWVPYEDSTPIETEARIVKPLEEQLATMPGLKSIGSSSRSDNGSIELEFHGSVDMDDAYNGASDRIERTMPDLPDDVERAYIWRFDPSDEPVIWAGISVPAGTEDVHYLVTRLIQKRLERIPGVGRVDVWGVDEAIVWIEFDREAVMAHGVDLLGLMNRLGADNFQLASGRVEDRGQVRYVRALARFEDLDDIRGWPVGEGVRLEDVAKVSYRAAASADINRIDGQDGAALAINKESSANTVEVCEEVRAAFAELEADPRLAGFEFPVFFDQGALITDSMDALEESALEGGVLAVLVLILFLREWRITALIAATIPSSILLALGVMYFTGSSLNLLSMLGLMLATGMIVDNAVVVVEAIYRRRQGGEPAVSAAIEGTAEMLLPIVASTLTSVVVFLPMLLMSEDATFTFFLGALALPIIYLQIGALLITLLFTPLSTVWLGRAQVREEARWIAAMARAVDRGVGWTLTHRVDATMWALGALLLTLVLPMKAVGCSDESESNLNDFTVRYEVPAAYTYQERLEVVKAFEKMAEDHADSWGVRVYRSRLSSSSRNGRLFVYLDDAAEGAMPREEVLDEVKKVLPDLPGVTATVGWGESGQTGNSSISVQLVGEDTERLRELSAEALRRIRSVEGVLGAHSDVESEGQDEIQLGVQRQIALTRGISAEAVGRLISFAMRGMPLAPWYQGEKEVRVFSRFTQEDRESVDQLLAFQMGSPGGAVPLRNLLEPTVAKGWGGIDRQDRQTSLALTVDLGPDLSKEDAFVRVENALGQMEWPRGYGVDRGNEWEEQQASDDARSFALLLSAVFVVLIMGVVFESLFLPVVVMSTIPMAVFGVWWGLWLSGTPFDAMAGVGVVILMGIVVNNGIVLVDVVIELEKTGLTRDEALRKAVGLRLRPILMTALTAIMGVVPMAFGGDTFIGIPYAPLGRVVLAGMLVATVLTLFFVPLVYTIVDDWRHIFWRRLAYVWPRSRPA